MFTETKEKKPSENGCSQEKWAKNAAKTSKRPVARDILPTLFDSFVVSSGCGSTKLGLLGIASRRPPYVGNVLPLKKPGNGHGLGHRDNRFKDIPSRHALFFGMAWMGRHARNKGELGSVYSTGAWKRPGLANRVCQARTTIGFTIGCLLHRNLPSSQGNRGRHCSASKALSRKCSRWSWPHQKDNKTSNRAEKNQILSRYRVRQDRTQSRTETRWRHTSGKAPNIPKKNNARVKSSL